MKHFVRVETKEVEKKKNGFKQQIIAVYPKFLIEGQDIMKKGGYFYAVLDPLTNKWSLDETRAMEIVDRDLENYRDQNYIRADDGSYHDENGRQVVLYTINDSTTGQLKEFRLWLNSLGSNHRFHMLDNDITFKDEIVTPEQYRTKELPYKLYSGSINAYNELMNVLYDDENRAKIEWAIGSVIAGDSKEIEKMLVLCGPPGSGKSTVLDLVKKLFEGYWTIFIASDLATKSNQFGTELFKDNPLIAIQDDGTLKKIDSPAINEIISHKDIVINEKRKQQYKIKSNAIMFLATNDNVDISDETKGIARRLLDTYPSGNKVSVSKYRKLVKDMDFELGAIAQHCLEVYQSMGKEYYSNYSPNVMINRTNVLRNFVWDNFNYFTDEKKQGLFLLSEMYKFYKEYIDDSGLKYCISRLEFKERIGLYFKTYHRVKRIDDRIIRNVYEGFKDDIFNEIVNKEPEDEPYIWLDFNKTTSLFDKIAKDYPAQNANDDGKPIKKWADVETTLKDIDTKELHYVKVPTNHIVIDFDIKDDNGEKSYEKNLEAASKWPATYSELSKSGSGIHLHYIYEGDAKQLSRVYDDNIEIKVFVGNSSLRRKLTKCNDIQIATISSGLPIKEEKTMAINRDYVINEVHIRSMIERNLNKEFHGATKPSIDFIKKILDDAYESGVPYDVRDMRNRVLSFANNSTHQAEACVKLVAAMKFNSDNDILERKDPGFKNDELVFFDVEVFPNLFIICWKKAGKDVKPIKMINPRSDEVEALFNFKLVGFNCRRYDNHIMYAASMGYTPFQLYSLSQSIINGGKNCFFGEAYNLSYTDVYDFLSAGNKKSLKQWEIELGLTHIENAHPWDEPLDEKYWDEVANYCCNDVIATEAVFDHNVSDWVARKILAKLSGLTVNDTTNTHTTKIIFGNEKHPQSVFNYPDLSMMFPGYKFDAGVSTYRGEVVGEGGYVYAEPGVHTNVALLDIASMHPSSIEAMNLFGPYTKNFLDLKYGRVHIKHIVAQLHDGVPKEKIKEYDIVRSMLGGKLAEFLDNDEELEGLPNGLKTAINSVYGLTSASFDNKFRDPRNVDNVVAKRGALFMVDLKHAVQEKGFTVAHIKTDSIKIPNATPDIINFVMEFGKKYGYIFEHEETYDRMCLVNDAVYIAKYKKPHKDKKTGKDIWWTATGAQFAHPYLFKTLFSHDPIKFEDMCEMKAVQSSMYLDMNEDLMDVSLVEKALDKLEKDFKAGKVDDKTYMFEKDKMTKEIAQGHNYIFIGKVGNFCPIKPGCGGGRLVRDQKGKMYSVTGTKDYRWLEADVVKGANKTKDIDKTYFKKLVDEAVNDISQYTDIEWFTDVNSNNEEVPFVS